VWRVQPLDVLVQHLVTVALGGGFGRHAHLGLANLMAWRVAQRAPNTFSIAVNDYGFELLSATDIDWSSLLPELLKEETDDDALLQQILQSLNASELAQRRFREIARVSGLIFQGHPGEKRSSRQLQASSSLFWEVFRKYDPGNRLLQQAEAELLAQELEIGRLRTALHRMARQALAGQTAGACDAVRLPADGRASAREAQQRKRGRPHRTHAGPAGKGRRR
jgi:Lhr-like helicase